MANTGCSRFDCESRLVWSAATVGVGTILIASHGQSISDEELSVLLPWLLPTSRSAAALPQRIEELARRDDGNALISLDGEQVLVA